MTKHLYKGSFNYQGQCFTLYTHAVNEEKAFINFCHQLSKKIGYSPSYIANYFYRNDRDGYLITLEKGEG